MRKRPPPTHVEWGDMGRSDSLPRPDRPVPRRQLLRRAHAFLERRGSPRFHMTLMVAVTGLAGFLASFAMLHLGLSRMWLRYGLAVAVAYLVFLGMVWLWVLHHRGHLNLDLSPVDALDGVDLVSSLGRVRSGAGGSLPAEDPSPSVGGGLALDLDEAVVVLVVIAAVASALIASIYVISTAPALLGEVLVDGVLSVGLYRRLRRLDQRHWLESAMMRTGFPIVAVAVFFMIAGAVMQLYAPEAVSIGGVWQHWLASH